VTLEQVAALGNHWMQEPPTEQLVALIAQYVGVYKPRSISTSGSTVSGPLKLIAERPPAALQSMKSRFAGGAIRAS
jgi:hypothetical protein